MELSVGWGLLCFVVVLDVWIVLPAQVPARGAGRWSGPLRRSRFGDRFDLRWHRFLTRWVRRTTRTGCQRLTSTSSSHNMPHWKRSARADHRQAQPTAECRRYSQHCSIDGLSYTNVAAYALQRSNNRVHFRRFSPCHRTQNRT